MSAPDDFEKNPIILGINNRNVDAVEKWAADIRHEVIDAAFGAMIAFAVEDLDRIQQLTEYGLADVLPIRRKVVQSFSGLPFAEGSIPQNALRMLLKPDISEGQTRQGLEKMFIYLPVPDDVTLDETFDAEEIDRPPYVVVEDYDVDGKPTCYRIADEGMEEFQSAYLIKGEQLEGIPSLGSRVIWYASKRVNPYGVIVADIFTRMTDWAAQNQRAEAPGTTQLDT